MRFTDDVIKFEGLLTDCRNLGMMSENEYLHCLLRLTTKAAPLGRSTTSMAVKRWPQDLRLSWAWVLH